MPANSRRSIFLNQVAPNIHAGAAFFIGDGAEFVVERSIFFGGGNGGHNTIGIPEWTRPARRRRAQAGPTSPAHAARAPFSPPAPAD